MSNPARLTFSNLRYCLQLRLPPLLSPLTLKLLHHPPSNLSIRPHHLPKTLRLRTTRLPDRIPRRNPLHNNRIAVRRKRIPPQHILSRIPAGHFFVPVDELAARGQAGRRAGDEALVRATDGFRFCGGGGEVGGEEVGQVGERVADCAHFPVEDAYHPRLRFVEDHVVDFVVAVDEGRAIGGLGGRVREERDHFVLVRDFAHGDVGFDVLCGGLGQRDGVEGGDLAVVEAGGFAVGAEIDGGGGDAVEFCEGGYGGVPPGIILVSIGSCRLEGERGVGRGNVHLRSLLGRHPRDRWVLEYTSIEELHDVEVAAHHALILAECVGFGHGDIGLLEGVNDAVLAVDLVRSLRAPSSACFLHMNGVGDTHFR